MKPIDDMTREELLAVVRKIPAKNGREFGELKRMVQYVALSCESNFTSAEIARQLKEDRRVVATVLRRMFHSRHIVKVVEGYGNIPTLYHRAARASQEAADAG